jgi:hypothetical protein
MQDETQNPGDAAQEPNNAPDPWGDAANLEGFEEFGQEQPSGEEAADVVGKRLPPWMVRTAAGAGAEEADQFAPEGLAAESEDPAASADLSDPALYDTGANADPWGGTPSPDTAEQEEEPTFTPPWEDSNAPPSGTEEQELGGSFNPLFTASWEDLGVPSPGTAEQEGEPSFTPLWEDPNVQPYGTVEQGEEPTFAAPWEDASTTPDPDTSTFAVGWDSVPDIPPEGQEDYSNAEYGEMPSPLDVWSDPNAVAEEITAAGDIWKDTVEGFVEDVSEAIEDAFESYDEDLFGDTYFDDTSI